GDRSNVRKIAQAIESLETGGHLRRIERLADFNRDSISPDAKDLPVRGDDAKFSDDRSGLIGSCGRRTGLLCKKTCGHSPAEERREQRAAQPSHPIRLHAPNLLRRRVAQGRCLLLPLWARFTGPESLIHWRYHRRMNGSTKAGNHLKANPNWERYSRQILFAGMGEEGQRQLLESSAVVAGCGAIGSATAQVLARAGVGRLRVIDRDFVEPSNLQRQALFDEQDARGNLPKAVAAERK